ncbi:sigma-54 dependent transcriptional regulator [Lysobacter sp. A6]|uniref:Sigma-54 dependent transcriptional regulator n=1 Tax=Noviluteimonas lactosilytica TaxID=2888523 RepID=A0ABS8JG84_9GAMM|nr:sigma-54 dependent transcriptional regulator [Lysobacter lactosilyticus]MCC8362488.1 sigma-54 dependent transcriptional regulator [Lysobacter lactosilyticus]
MNDQRSALIVDDERDIRELLVLTLGRMGLRTETASSLGEARALLAVHRFDLCLTDMRLPDGSGIDLIAEITAQYPQTPVAMITAFGNVEAAVEALKAGAFDFVSKPVDLAVLRGLVKHALDLPQRGARRLNAPASDALATRLYGDSPAIVALKQTLGKVARSQAPVYIAGESGTGKELVARTIHEQGPRASGPFVPVNCGAIPAELMESEFFGHKKGSFTGAHVDKMGLFQAAEGGTLFLDEVAELPLPMQVKLLRAIQEKSVRAVGANNEVAVDVRILSATHKDLAALIADGRFRHDLYYRINVIELRVPPLRERLDDLPGLSSAILHRLAGQQGRAEPVLAPDAVDALRGYPFPGNVRELENILERALALAEDDRIEAADLRLPTYGPPLTAPMSAPASVQLREALIRDPRQADPRDSMTSALPSYIEEIERNAIQQALEDNRYNKTKAAAQLGITFRALRYKLKKLGID